MGFMSKIKNILFEEEEDNDIPTIEETSEVRPKVSQVKTKQVEEVRFKQEEVESLKKEEEKQSPFQTFDEEEFDRIAAINRNRLLERDRKAREAKALEQRRLDTEKREEQRREELRRDIRIDNRDTRVDTRVDAKKRYNNVSSASKVEPVTEHKFKPSPVISPVYGILDKNYKKEDILPRASSEGTLPKVMDVDKVREKAFGVLEEELEKKDPLKNFESDKDTEIQNPVVELLNDDIEEDDVLTKTAEIKITDLESHLDEPVVNIPKQDIIFEETREDKNEALSPVKEDSKNNQSSSEGTLESDLFNLIDSMYENRKDN